jgi:CheY-like chemotaxis protein
VDDDADGRLSLRRLLEKAGYAVVEAEHGLRRLAAGRTPSPSW